MTDMSIERQMEREEGILDDQLNNGEISDSEYRAAINELQRDYQEAAEEAAQDAYDNELRSW